ncbi:hypothetical protein [Bacillus cereus]|uniref:hypothetical protein n=1 Tax=Bacillus cereus TaxID=1396 RepID=UPI0014836A5A|nr:hypothetical protein [Bacillus cereus]
MERPLQLPHGTTAVAFLAKIAQAEEAAAFHANAITYQCYPMATAAHKLYSFNYTLTM